MAKQRLGRGLEALIPVKEGEISPGTNQPHLPVDLIDPNPFQPRKEFGDEEMADLINSVKAKGILQPITVRESGGDRYQLIAGERRLRAAKALGIEKVPAYILSINSEVDMMEYSLVENIQREDLNPVDQAEAFALLHSKYDLTHRMIAEQVGMSRPAVANTLRLLSLPSEIKASLKRDEITMGHARALLGLPQSALMQRLWKKIISQGLSVRQTEAAVKEYTKPAEEISDKPAAKMMKSRSVRPAFLTQVEGDLRSHLNTKVRVKSKDDQAGIIEISYYSQSDLDRMLDLILGREEQAQQ